jgi:voltage-gated sodium channel
MVVTDPETAAMLSSIDDACLYCYIAECCIKVIGLGLTKYFQDDWNKFDFVMIGISLLSSFF